MMSEALRRDIPLGFSSLIIIVMIIDYYIFIPGLRAVSEDLQKWAVISVALASGVGIINICTRSARMISRRAPYWYMEIWQWVMMIVVAITGFIGGYGVSHQFEWIMVNMYQPIDASIYAMVMFDITYAFYRTFRLRTLEASLLFVAAFFTMSKNTPLFGAIVPILPAIGDWFIGVPSGAGSRAFTIITSIGIIFFAIRALFWYERGTIGVVE
jgi:hypothetical protein